MAIQIVSFHIDIFKDCDFPMKDCDFPSKSCDFPIEIRDVPIEICDVPIKLCGFPIKNDDFPMKHGDFQPDDKWKVDTTFRCDRPSTRLIDLRDRQGNTLTWTLGMAVNNV